MTLKSNKIDHRGVQCSGCKRRMFSFYTHDYKTCGCEVRTMIDGGKDYLRYGWMPEFKKPKPIKYSEKLDGPYPVVKAKESRWPY